MTTRIYHIPSDGICGVHMVRYTNGRLGILSSRDKAARTVAWELLSQPERELLAAQITPAELVAWRDADLMPPRNVPQGLQAPEWDYSGLLFPTPKPDYEVLRDQEPYGRLSSPPPPQLSL